MVVVSPAELLPLLGVNAPNAGKPERTPNEVCSLSKRLHPQAALLLQEMRQQGTSETVSG